MSITDGARGNDQQQLRARLAAAETRANDLPARFAGNSQLGNYRRYTQTAHGFAVGEAVRHNGSAWVKSKADTAANSVVAGIVVAVPHANAFVLAAPGSFVGGISGLTAGSVHYLSAATAGGRTTTPPTIAIPIIFADKTTTGVVMSCWQGGASPVAPTEDGTVWCSKSDLSGGEWVMTVDIGRNATGKAGKLQLLSPNASGVAVEIDAALVTASGKKLTVREIDVCDAGTAKKMLILASAPY